LKNQTPDPAEESGSGEARGWTNAFTFAKGGWEPRPGDDGALRVLVLNTESGTGSSMSVRHALLAAAIERAADKEATVLVTTAGFFGCDINADGRPSWPGIGDISGLQGELIALARSWPRSLMVAVGVDVTGSDQRQWWFAGGEGSRRCEILRDNETRAATPLAERRVLHAGYGLLGFVCGEGYEWPETELATALSNVDVVAVSAHVEINRIWEPAIDPELKRWAFQRRFRFISGYAGAALAHARGTDDRYVRNCDDWFVHRGGEPFPEPRVGVALVVSKE
jgi:hypothetical protein